MQEWFNSIGNRLRQRYRATPVPAFLAWWGGELGELVPDSLSERLMPPKPQVWLVPAETGGGDFRVWRADAKPQVLDVFGAGEDAQLLRGRWRDILADFRDGRPQVRLCLHESQVLEIPVEMPDAVEGNLDQALRFQLDQLSPFRADQVMVDHRIDRHDSARGRLELTLCMVPNDRVEPILDRARSFGAVVHAVDTLVEEDPPRPAGFNLLPEGKRPRFVHARARFNALLGLALLVGLGLVMAQSLILRERSVSVLQEEANQLRSDARRVIQLQQELEDSLLAANYLARKRAAQPPVIRLLDEITRILPDDVWLQQFQLMGSDLRIQGQADGSQRIVGLLAESELFESPEIMGSISIDPRSGQERFRSQVQVITSGDPDAAAEDAAGAGS
jgi:general secretion pathway protein L